MIYTGYYARLNEYIEQGLTPIAISGAVPNFYDTDTHLWWKFLAPSYDIFSKWKSGELNDFGYVSRYIPERLDILDKQDLKQKLLSVENPILLCYEKEGFCHRHVLADWIEMNLGLIVEEYKGF